MPRLDASSHQARQRHMALPVVLAGQFRDIPLGIPGVKVHLILAHTSTVSKIHLKQILYPQRASKKCPDQKACKLYADR